MIGAATGGLDGAEQMMNCAKPSFIDDGVTGLKEYESELEGRRDRAGLLQGS